MELEIYNLESKLLFGKHNGITLSQVLKIDTSYINWCILNHNRFYIDFETLELIKVMNPEFKLNISESLALFEKQNVFFKNKLIMHKCFVLNKHKYDIDNYISFHRVSLGNCIDISKEIQANRSRSAEESESDNCIDENHFSEEPLGFYDNPYYNASLDDDQQSMEFWDSF
jgi:hypothetical protein